jgi:SNF2 family DNA or RNA helicase
VDVPDEDTATQEGPPSPGPSTTVAAAGSAKVAALLAQLRADAGEAVAAGEAGGSSAAGGPPRSVVFSQFTSFLDVVQRALAAEGIPTARLDGKTSAKRRAELLRTFQAGGPLGRRAQSGAAC